MAINQPGDRYEQEADRVADEVMHMPEPRLQRQGQEEEEEEEVLQPAPLADYVTPLAQRQAELEEEEEEEPIQAEPVGDAMPKVSSELEAEIRSLRGGGQPLSASERAFFEPRFGVDFRSVRIHTGPQATAMTQALNARVFTRRNHIVFGSGFYVPETAGGRRLLAHELTHVVQQRGAAPYRSNGIRGSGAMSLHRLPIIARPGLQREIVQRDFLDLIGFRFRQSFTRSLDMITRGGVLDPLALIFDDVVASNIVMASAIRIPTSWRQAVQSYALANLLDGAVLMAALARFPSFYRGGWIMSLQPAAAAMTLDHSIFVPSGSSLSLSTYVHELVHVMQYGLVGTTSFLVSYFGMSGATIAYRWLRGLPTNPMRSSPHENQAYDLQGRFDTWYQGQYGVHPRSVTV